MVVTKTMTTAVITRMMMMMKIMMSYDDTGRECPEDPNDKCSAMVKTLHT
jgi:hypothetical protein